MDKELKLPGGGRMKHPSYGSLTPQEMQALKDAPISSTGDALKNEIKARAKTRRTKAPKAVTGFMFDPSAGRR